MIRVSVEVRGGDAPFDVAVYAGSIREAVGIAEGRYPGHEARVVFPIDGEQFFGGPKPDGYTATDSRQPSLLSDRVR